VHASPPPSRWLLLIHQLPKEPAYARVKIGRRLSRVGALALKNSVYVLPKTDSTTEDFQWIRREVLEAGGDATVVEAQLALGISDYELEAKFREVKDAEYAQLASEARALGQPGAGRNAKRGLSEAERAALHSDVERLVRRVQEIHETDFFGASGREIVSGLLDELLRKTEPPQPVAQSESEPPRLSARTWVTRTGVHIDRIASAWLIRRFIDPDAVFKFVHAKGYVPVEGELRFDMFEAEFSHEGENCTFETLLRRFDLKPSGLQPVAEIVHDIDLKDAKYARPETQGVAACINGICKLNRSDELRIAQGSAVFEGLFAHFSRREVRD